MSLAGNLADLSLGDILQILNLSQKSGVLTLDFVHDSVDIVFVDGKIVTMMPREARLSIGEFLANTYKTSQQFDLIANVIHSSPQANWNYLIQLYFQDPKIRPIDIAKQYMQWLMNRVYSANTGTFRFSMDTIDRKLGELATCGWVPIIKPGLNPQFLAMEAARASDESQLKGAPNEHAAVAAHGAIIELEKLQFVVIDDNPKVLEVLFNGLQERGYRVAKMIRSVNGLDEWLQEAPHILKEYFFLVDLVMPKADRSGVLGGLDALRLIQNRDPASLSLLLVDVESDQIEEKVRTSGALGSVQKGTRRAFREQPEQAGADMLDKVVQTVLGVHPMSSTTEAATPPNREGPHDPFAGLESLTLSSEGNETSQASNSNTTAENHPRALALMEGMLDELIEAESVSEVTLLILRFVSEILDRAVLLDIRGDFIYGRGQFGLAVRQADELVRRIKIPLAAESFFKLVTENRQAYQGILAESPIHQTFINIIGGGTVQECFICPLLAERRVTAILYGDNQMTSRPIAGASDAQIFLKQAGMAYDKAILREQLRKGE